MDEHPAAARQPPRPEDEPLSSPFLVAPDDPGPPSARRRGLLDVRALAAALAPGRGAARVWLGALAAAAIVVALVLWGLAPRTRSLEAGEDAARGRVLDPIRPRADARTGEQVAPFSGFAVSVETEPAGALVSVGGVPRGEAPVLAGLDCAPGDRVEISAQKAGYAVARTGTTCRRDALVKLTVRLAR
ncbi:MAG TPA: PEGA domain-containing protein [Anaeromyxobacter sp.]